MTRIKTKSPVVLCILDGWGYREETDHNAIALGNTPNFDRLWKTCPHSLLQASEEDVGLPVGQVGNSEVGHLNLGAGRVVTQTLPRINRAIAADDVERRLQDFIQKLKARKGTCHLMGVLSDGGIHSHQDHIVALAKILDRNAIPVAFHVFLDGRDAPPQSAKTYLEKLLLDTETLQHFSIATVSGRYYAMDRDKRWDRTEKAFAAITKADAPKITDIFAAVQKSYDHNIHDEFFIPSVVEGYQGLQKEDAVLMANFRADRARQLLTKLTEITEIIGMIKYSRELAENIPILFPPEPLLNGLGEVVSKAGKTQLRIAETEKYPHVTFFFNGGRERLYEHEDRILVPSPNVATYDLKPEMSASDLTEKLVGALETGAYDLIISNYANSDMVGHTGNLNAAIKAVETVDHSLGQLEQAIRKQNGVLLITADHGNCETIYNPETDGPHTSHTLNPVPAILVNAPPSVQGLKPGKLADVAPTLLSLMGLETPEEMTGENLLVSKGSKVE